MILKILKKNLIGKPLSSQPVTDFGRFRMVFDGFWTTFDTFWTCFDVFSPFLRFQRKISSSGGNPDSARFSTTNGRIWSGCAANIRPHASIHIWNSDFEMTCPTMPRGTLGSLVVITKVCDEYDLIADRIPRRICHNRRLRNYFVPTQPYSRHRQHGFNPDSTVNRQRPQSAVLASVLVSDRQAIPKTSFPDPTARFR